MNKPKFAIVGHPNKGKSSIVSTLTHNQNIQISKIPGTTIKNQTFEFKINDEILYTLIDTPGFQRPTKVLNYLKENCSKIEDRPEAIIKFLDDKENKINFPDEYEILTPISKGAGIIYVIDCSSPFNSEYEAEIEILRWSSVPRLALINPIKNSNYLKQWNTCLSQYFNIVTTFNAVYEDFDKQLDLLSSFSQLNDQWKYNLTKAKVSLKNDRKNKNELAYIEVEKLIKKIINHKIEKNIKNDDSNLKAIKEEITSQYQKDIVNFENQTKNKIEKIYKFSNLERDEEIETLNKIELFSNESFNLFGLAKKDIMNFSTIAGAITGASVDIAAFGSTLFSGVLIGGAIGYGSAYFGSSKLLEVKIVNQALGNKVTTIGPLKDVNFPHIIFNRVINHLYLIQKRTHANKNKLDLKNQSYFKLDSQSKKELERYFNQIRNKKDTYNFNTFLKRLLSN